MRRRQITRLTAFGDLAAADQGPTSGTAGAAPRGRTRPLRANGLCADGARPLHAGFLRGVPLAGRQSSDRGQHGRARLREPDHALCRRHGTRRRAPAAPGCWRRLPPSMPTGKPTNAEFPSAASTPPVNIMTPEPGSAPAPPRPSRRLRRRPRRCRRRARAAAPPPAAAAKKPPLHRNARRRRGRARSRSRRRVGCHRSRTCGFERMIVFKILAAR